MEDGLPSIIGEQMHAWARDLWSLPRSLTGAGVRATFAYLRELLPGLATTEIPSGSQALDWQVPLEWSVRDAYVIGPNGQRFADWRVNNLHLVGYSIPVDQVLSREELDRHLYSIESLPQRRLVFPTWRHPWRRYGYALRARKRNEGRCDLPVRARLLRLQSSQGAPYLRAD